MIGVSLPMLFLATALAGDDRSIVAVTAELGVRVFQVAISPGDGSRCTLSPTCSAFARQALRRDGVLGLPLITDRLVREAVSVDLPLLADGRHHADPLRDHAPLRDLLLGGCRRQRRAGSRACL